MLDAVRVGPIIAQARDVLELLEDHRRCQVVLVTIPEETPVNEAVETAFSLEDRVGIGLGPIVVNGVYPRSPGSAPTRRRPPRRGGVPAAGRGRGADRGRGVPAVAYHAADEQVGRLEAALPLPQIRLPFLFTTDIGPPELER